MAISARATAKTSTAKNRLASSWLKRNSACFSALRACSVKHFARSRISSSIESSATPTAESTAASTIASAESAFSILFNHHTLQKRGYLKLLKILGKSFISVILNKTMGIFDFFKGRKEELRKSEIISFKDLGSWIENKLSESQNQKTKFHALVKNCVSKLSEEIKQGTESFKDIGWEKIKEEERVKQIVKENLNNYESHLAGLTQELNNLQESNLNKEKIYEIFSSFDKKTAINYQKSTYLIGKELEFLNKSVSIFFKEIDKIHNENKEIISKAGALSNLNKNMKVLEESDKTISKIREEISSIEKEIARSEDKLKNYETSLNEIKKGAEYLEWNKIKEKSQERTENLKREMQDLHSIINFKALARIWHENPLEMQILTDYRSNFNLAFHKDKGEVLARLTSSLEN